MSDSRLAEKKTFTFGEAQALLPEVLPHHRGGRPAPWSRSAPRAWPSRERARGEGPGAGGPHRHGLGARARGGAGLEVKGLWLVDFDNGSGYYCWQYPEEGLQFYPLL